MLKQVLSVCCLFGFTFTVSADHPEKTINQWLEKMHHAANMINYDGTFVYGQNNQLSSMKIVHGVDNSGIFERLISLDGSGREVIRSGNTVKCILPDKKAVVVEKSRPDSEFPPSFPVKIDRLNKYYSFHIMGEGRVAGQETKKIIIKPRDKYRYGHELWVDEKTGLLLKNHLIDENGKTVEQFMFTHIDYPEKIRDAAKNINSKSETYTWYDAKSVEPKLNESMQWKVMHMPPGFYQDTTGKRNMTMSKMPVEHMVFTDGLSSVSVFIEKKMKNSKNLMGTSTMGAVNAYGRSFNQYHITVVGEAPTASIKMMGDAVSHINH